MSQNNKGFILTAANILALLGWISANIYLPSIPALEQYFHASPKDLRFSISLFLLGFAVSQIFWGAFSERLGRKKPILYGLFLASFGTLLLLFAPNIFVFNLARFIEGAGIGAAAVLSRTLFTDSFDKLELAKAFSIMSTLANIMPALAPIVGGYLLLLAGWRAIFIFLLLYTLLLLGLIFSKMHETNQNIKPNFNAKQALSDYVTVLKSREFLGYLFPYALLSGGMIGFYAATPFIFIYGLHLAAHHYAFLIIFTVASYVLGANLARPLAQRIGFEKAIFTGICCALISGIALFCLWVNFPLSIPTVIVPMMLYTFAAGIVSPNANASSLSAMSNMAGPAAAVIGCFIYVASSVLSAIITSMNLGSLSSLAAYVMGIVILAIITFGKMILLKKPS